jgi:hypothetical protein
VKRSRDRTLTLYPISKKPYIILLALIQHKFEGGVKVDGAANDSYKLLQACRDQGYVSSNYNNSFNGKEVGSAQPREIPVGTAAIQSALSPGVKRRGREAYNSPPSSAEEKNDRAILPLPNMPS